MSTQSTAGCPPGVCGSYHQAQPTTGAPPRRHSFLHIWERVGKTKLRPDDTKLLYSLGWEEDKVSFQIVGMKRKQRTTLWSLDNHLVRKVIQRAFNLKAPRQRVRAGRWARIIYLYFRVGLTETDIAEQLGMTCGAVGSILHSIRQTEKSLYKPAPKRG